MGGGGPWWVFCFNIPLLRKGPFVSMSLTWSNHDDDDNDMVHLWWTGAASSWVKPPSRCWTPERIIRLFSFPFPTKKNKFLWAFASVALFTFVTCVSVQCRQYFHYFFIILHAGGGREGELWGLGACTRVCVTKCRRETAVGREALRRRLGELGTVLPVLSSSTLLRRTGRRLACRMHQVNRVVLAVDPIVNALHVVVW